MIRKVPIIVILLLIFAGTSYTQTGCPGCVLSLPEDLGPDTIYLSAAPDGQAGVYYEGDISFRLPKTTTPVAAVDPEVPGGLPISKITISGVSNVPPGLSWEPSQAEFDTSDETDGCVRLCGVPLQPGLYLVDVIITARVVVVDQTASVTVPILIQPAQSTTEGFSMVNNSGCGSVEVSFQNNVPSNGKAGFSYSWDFGNGNTSTAEDPADQLYDLPGVYPVTYQATIDTTGYFLTRVNVNAVGCSDALGGRPDLKVNVLDPAGALIYVTDIVDNAQIPVSFEMNLPLDTGVYILTVVDADNALGGADDLCGTIPFSRNTSGNLSDGDLVLTIQILHPVSTVTATDTVYVYDQPDAPLISRISDGPLCEGDTLLLVAGYAERLQWYQDSVPILAGVDDTLAVTKSGQYWVVYTSPDGCISSSEPEPVSFGKIPEQVLFVNENNELNLFDPSLLPAESAIAWYKDGELLNGFVESSYCIDASGDYTIEVTDLATGCSASYSQAIAYNPDYPNCISPVENVLPEGLESVRLSPNPTHGPVQWTIEVNDAMQVQASLHTLTGQQLRSENWWLAAGMQNREWDISELPAGMYLVRISANGQGRSWRIVKF